MMKFFIVLLCFTVIDVSAHAQETNNIDAPIISFTENLAGYDYPFPVKHFDFNSQGKSLSMAYMYLSPTNDQMETVVLFHGKNFNGAYWKETAEYLQSLGYGVLIPDQIGFGKSSKPTDYQYSFSALAQNTNKLLSSLNIENPIIVGHSMGGMVASRYALQYPQQTAKLLLINPIGLENYLRYVDYKDTQFFYENELSQTPEKIIAYQKKNYYDGQWNDEYAALTEPLIGWLNGSDWDKIAQVNALTYDMIFTQPIIEEFNELEVPTILIIGTRDRTGPGRNWQKPNVPYELGRYDLLGDKIKQRNPAIEVVEMEGLGHLPHIEDFDRFKNVFDEALRAN